MTVRVQGCVHCTILQFIWPQTDRLLFGVLFSCLPHYTLLSWLFFYVAARVFYFWSNQFYLAPAFNNVLRVSMQKGAGVSLVSVASVHRAPIGPFSLARRSFTPLWAESVLDPVLMHFGHINPWKSVDWSYCSCCWQGNADSSSNNNNKTTTTVRVSSRDLPAAVIDWPFLFCVAAQTLLPTFNQIFLRRNSVACATSDLSLAEINNGNNNTW